MKTFKTEKRGRSRRWFSLDSLIGKAMCILLAVILAIGALLAPKLINNLYDAGTLLQISYIDMELTPYAVAYTDFQKKMEAAAREKTAGNKLSALTTQETGSQLNDAELTKLVNKEMTEVERGMDWLFTESWWSALTTDNLVVRKKNTVYAKKRENAQEMAPFTVWTLVFQVTDKQKEVKVSDKKGGVTVKNQFTTDKLIVCMDADFYKIYAVALQGDVKQLAAEYGWGIQEITQNYGQLKEKYTDVKRDAMSTYLREIRNIRMFFVERFMQGWTDYWGVTLKDRAYSVEALYDYDAANYMGGYLVFRDGTAEASPDGTSPRAAGTGETGAASTGIVGTAGAGAASVGSVEQAEADAFFEGDGSSGLGYYEMDGVGVYVFMPENRGADETYLEVGMEAEWEKKEEGEGIFKLGCREFFEMLQF